MNSLACACVVWLAVFAGVAQADVLSLKDGRMFDGVKLSRTEGAIVIHFTNGDVSVPEDQVHDAIIQNDTSFVPETDEERAMVAKGFVRYEGQWMDPARRDRAVKKKVEEQQARVAEMKRIREWRNRNIEDTKNFHFESTVPVHVFESYRDLCETYFTEFCKMWKIKKPRGLENLPLSLYIDHDKFMEITGMPPGVGGFFQFVPAPFELHIFYERLDPRLTEEVMYHEVGHYLQKLIDVDFKYPHWPGESLCEYYGASTWDPVKKKLTWGLVNESRLAQIRTDISLDEWVHLEDMIKGCQDRNFHDYSWGWSFVHMLLESSKYQKKFQDFFLGLANARDIDRILLSFGPYQLRSVEGEEMLDAFMRYMGLKTKDDLLALEKEWHEYIQKELTISSSRGLESAAYRAYQQDRPKKAKRMWEEAIASGTKTALTYYRYGNLLDEEGEYDKARDNWRKAIVLDPVTPEFYIVLGESLLTGLGRDKTEAKRLIGLALELEPDNLYLERNAKRILDD